MNTTRRLLLLTVLLMALVVSLPGGAVAGQLAPELAAKLTTIDADEFVRVIVRMEEQPFVSATMGADVVEFMLKEAAARSQAPVLDFFASEQISGGVAAFNSFWLVNVAFAEIQAGLVTELAELPGVAYVYEDFEFTAPSIEATDVQPEQLRWEHVASTFAPEVWEMGYRGEGITIAVIDTGVDISHPDLAPAFGGTAPFHEGYWAEFDSNGNIVPGSEPHDTSGHGTHVSGTAAARNTEYTIGMAPEATLAHGLVIPGGSGSFPQVLGGMQWVAESGFDVVNGSFGAGGTDLDMAVATDNLANMGVVPVFANGNLDPLDPTHFPPEMPGNTPSALAVGSFDSEGEEAIDNWGGVVEYPGYEYDEFTRIKPDISAPGVDVYSTFVNGGYALGSGTSMATPHVAGAVALLLSAGSNLSVDEVKEILYATTGGHAETLGWEDIPTKDVHFGWGRLNVLRAVEQVEAPEPSAEVPVHGSVFTADKRLAGATVTFAGVHTYTFVTDERGEFAGEVPEGMYDVTAEALAYVSQTKERTIIHRGETVEINFELEEAPFGNIVGTVTDAETGTPLTGATAFVPETGAKATTEADGKFSFALPEGTYTLDIRAPGYFALGLTDITVIPEQSIQRDAGLAFGRETVAGKVTDGDGGPAAGVAVRVAESDVATTTAADGTYTLDLTAGDYEVEFSGLGFVTAAVQTTVEHGNTSRLDVELKADTGMLEGYVRDLNEQPIADAVIAVEALDLETTTDADGYYAFASVPAGTWRLAADHIDFWGQEATVIIERDKKVRQHFALQSVGENSPFRNSFDTPAEQAVWTFVNYSDSEHEWHFTQERSVSEPYSAWHGFVNEDGIQTYLPNQAVGMITPEMTIPSEVDDISMTFQLYGRIWGSATQWFGVYVTDVETDERTEAYVFNDITGPEEWFEVNVDMTPWLGRTVAVEFYFESNTSVCVACNDSGMFIDDIVVGTVDEALDSFIGGVVTDAKEQPIAGARVTVVELEPRGDVVRHSQAVTNAAGEYEMKVPAGGWTVHVSKAPDFVGAEQIVYATPDELVAADFTLDLNVPPAVVTGLDAAAGDGKVELSWSPNEDDVAGYFVYRSLDGEHFTRLGVTTETRFTVEQLQNGYTYYFRVSAVDEYGLEGEYDEVEAVPTDTLPTVSLFDVKPRSLARGGTFVVSAELSHPLDADASFEVVVEATAGDNVVREWKHADVPAGAFEAALTAVDMFDAPWAPSIYQLTLYATDDAGQTARSNTINVAVLAPLPQALSFVLGNNPFNPTQSSQAVEYALPAAGEVTVAVYTLDGRHVRTLVDEAKQPGEYVTFWDGTDNNGRVVLGGMYVVQVQFTDAEGERVGVTRHSVVVK